MDKIFNLNCQRIYATVLILVAVPVVFIGGLIVILITWARIIPDWILISSIVLVLATSLLVTLILLGKYNSVPAIITLNDWGITIRLQKRSIFFPRMIYTSAWTNINAFSSTFSNQKLTRFYKVGFNDPSIDIYIDDIETLTNSSEETVFSSFVLQRVNEFNRHTSPKTQINTKNFYQSNWAKNLTYLVWVILAFLLGISALYSNTIEWWRIAQFAALSGVWLASYYANNRKNN